MGIWIIVQMWNINNKLNAKSYLRPHIFHIHVINFDQLEGESFQQRDKEPMIDLIEVFSLLP